jgi:hypothetical protein
MQDPAIFPVLFSDRINESWTVKKWEIYSFQYVMDSLGYIQPGDLYASNFKIRELSSKEFRESKCDPMKSGL